MVLSYLAVCLFERPFRNGDCRCFGVMIAIGTPELCDWTSGLLAVLGFQATPTLPGMPDAIVASRLNEERGL